MNLHDPARPRLSNDALTYTDGYGHHLGAILDFKLELRQGGIFVLYNWFAADYNEFRQYECICKDLDELKTVLAEWVENPEKTMVERFNCDTPARRSPTGSNSGKLKGYKYANSVTLDDLGL